MRNRQWGYGGRRTCKTVEFNRRDSMTFGCDVDGKVLTFDVPVRTLHDMDEAEIAELERTYGCKVLR
jgi:hypothetical protein